MGIFSCEKWSVISVVDSAIFGHLFMLVNWFLQPPSQKSSAALSHLAVLEDHLHLVPSPKHERTLRPVDLINLDEDADEDGPMGNSLRPTTGYRARTARRRSLMLEYVYLLCFLNVPSYFVSFQVRSGKQYPIVNRGWLKQNHTHHQNKHRCRGKSEDDSP